MIRRISRGAAAAAALFIAAITPASCGQAILVAPDGSTMQMFVNPDFIAANGDTSVVSVLVIEPAGTPVPDGTVIQFFTTLGKIQEQAKTNDGVARVNLISDARSGTATVTAVSGKNGSDSGKAVAKTVTIGGPNVARVTTQAIDPTIDLKQGKSIASIRAQAFDASGNPVPGVTIRFTVASNPATDRLLDGTDITTNNNGDAVNRVQTNRTTAGTITIKVELLAKALTISDITIQVLAGS
ncbi:MAG TPA: hypothetical protein PLD86_12480 [Vicinamibacteria bacterium]|nr:hypothetical protein [Vicinamibacteria bacterium]